MAGKNKDRLPVEVAHADLERDSEDSIFRSTCPVCKVGLLCVSRNRETFDLEAKDRCLLCGQVVIYTDIEELKRKAGEK